MSRAGSPRRIGWASAVLCCAALATWVAWVLGLAQGPAISRTRACPDALLVRGALACGVARYRALATSCPDVAMPPSGYRVGTDCVPRPDADLMRRLRVVVDVNEADVVALQTLPGIGPVLAERIVARRPLPSLEALLTVKGIGPVKLRRIAPRAQIVAHPNGQRPIRTTSGGFHLGSPRSLKARGKADDDPTDDEHRLGR